MPSNVQVAPVTGKTPAQVATELRTLIRDQIWAPLRLTPPQPTSATPLGWETNLTKAREMISAAARLNAEIIALLGEGDQLSKLRKPVQTRNNLRKIREKIYESSRLSTQISNYMEWFGKQGGQGAKAKPSQNAELLKHAERAYALVQALPTIDNPSLGRADNALRAITAMLKVYYGIEVTDTFAHLPEIMPELLNAIRPEEKEPEAELDPQESQGPTLQGIQVVDLHIEPALPWRILTTSDYELETETIVRPMQGTDRAPSLAPGNPSWWEGGNCSAEAALLAFLHVRHNFTDNEFILSDQNHIVFARATPAKITTYNNMLPVYEAIQEVAHA